MAVVLFCSYDFLLFFSLVFLIYWCLPWHRARVGLLATASFVFYAFWSHWLALIVLVSTVVDYILARTLDSLTCPRRRRLLVIVSIVMNLGVLVYFKYADFFLHSLEQALRAAGARVSMPVLQLLAPIGISFYTFEAINYVVDVYRRKIPAERNLSHFLLFILFFPHLLAGPIVRARDFLPQIRRPKRWSWARFHLGGQYVLIGLFKKMVVADHMAIFADPVFADPTRFEAGTLWLAAIAYALQVYCDFSGYSDLAIGTAHMLGFKLAPNFNLPFLAPNIAEFWRRWHISLSSWVRDHVYIPLGGSRGSRWQMYRNLMIAMVLSGLWHGASWTCVAFGFIHGMFLLVHRWFRTLCEQRPSLDALLRTRVGTAVRIAFTFTCFVCSLVIFRCVTLAQGADMLGRMIVPHGRAVAWPNAILVWHAFAILALGHWLAQKGRWKRLRESLPSPVRGFGYACFLLLILVLAPMATKSFIYFQF
jgi:alginate O-acetyltransferase complex protein AlgI